MIATQFFNQQENNHTLTILQFRGSYLINRPNFSAKTSKALTLALSPWEREPEGWMGSPRPLGEGLGVRAYNFCQSTKGSTVNIDLSFYIF